MKDLFAAPGSPERFAAGTQFAITDDVGQGAIEVLDSREALGIGAGTDILVVDDDPGNLVAYEAALAPLGRNLVLARSGLEALAKLLDQDFALLLLDVSMPGMTGIETAERIRARPRNRGMPIIFITGADHRDDLIVEAYAAGAFDFVVKPILPQLLRAKVAVYLRLQERTQQLLRQDRELRDAHALLAEGHARERERIAAVATARRLAKLQEMTSGVAGAQTPIDVAAVTVRLGAEAVGADAAAMWLARPDGVLSLVGSHGVPEGVLESWHVITPSSPLPGARAFEQGQEIWVANGVEYAREAPEIIERARAADRVRAFVVLPLSGADQRIGILSFSYQQDHEFTEDERSFLRTLARACEQALERARLYVVELELRRAVELASKRKDELLAMSADHELVAAVAARDQFLRAVVHELRNAVAPALLVSEQFTFMADTPAAPPGLASRARMLTGNLQRLVGTIERVSEVASLWRGQLILDVSAVDLGEVTAEVCEEFAREAATGGASLRLERDAPVRGTWDRARVKRIVASLVSNAIRYAGGSIDICVTTRGPHAELSIRDAGPGIKPDAMTSLFDPFEPRRTSVRPAGGFGVGLWVTRTLCTAMRGGVTVENLPTGGACFTVLLPRDTQAE